MYNWNQYSVEWWGGGGGEGTGKKGAAKVLMKACKMSIPGQSQKKKKRLRKERYAPHIYETLRRFHPNTQFSPGAISLLDSLVNTISDRLVNEVHKLARYNSCNTISSREVETAVKLHFPDDLSKHAISEATKAVRKYSQQQHK